MELYNFFYTMTSVFSVFGEMSVRSSLYSGLIVGAVLLLVLFILQGVGLYVMAKKRDIKNRWMAFVPFVSILYIGKLAGECNVFGHKMKRIGLYTMLAQIVTSLLLIAIIVAEFHLYINCVENIHYTETGIPYWGGLEGIDQKIHNFYEFGNYLVAIFQLIYRILMIILIMALCKCYNPQNYIFMSILTFMIPMSRFIIIFVFRNRKAVDYAAYMRAKKEEYMRRQQYYYRNNPYNQNPYGNPYNNPYNRNPYNQNPYGQGNYNQPPYGQDETKKTPEDPFEEFSNGNHSDEEKSSSDGEEFFN